MVTAYISHDDCLKHQMIDGHPECPERLSAIQDQLIRAQVFDYLRHFDAPMASFEQLARVHDQDYINDIVSRAPREGLVHIDPDTYMSPFTLKAALHAAGAVVKATDLVISGEMSSAFCAVRPPGHHAERDQAMGFCFFNNVAVGVGQAMAVHGLQRVAIVDFDVHHGNGTESIFEDEPRVLVCSAYQYPLYPFSGRDTVPGRLINVPLNAGLVGNDFRQAITERWLSELRAFRPQMVFISAGFDGHLEDDMASWCLTEDDYAWVTREVLDIAAEYAEGRVVSVLEGGYSLSALGRSATAHIKALMA